MFEHFTFGAQPQTRHFEDSFPSPTDTSFIPLTPPTSYPFPHIHPQQYDLSDIVSRLQQQTLQRQTNERLGHRFEARENFLPRELQVDDEIDSTELEAETSFLPSLPTTASVSSRRLQRQLNVQLQSCSTHIKEINTLVENMIDSNAQCRITSRGYLSPPPSRDGDVKSPVFEVLNFGVSLENDIVDEGFFEGAMNENEDPEMTLRRVSVPAGIRKTHVRSGRSVEMITAGGRIKVKALPRMRRRTGKADRMK